MSEKYNTPEENPSEEIEQIELQEVDSLESKNDLEKIKEKLRNKFPKEFFISKFNYDMGDIAEERYEEFIDFYAEAIVIMENFLGNRNVDEIETDLPKKLIKRLLYILSIEDNHNDSMFIDSPWAFNFMMEWEGTNGPHFTEKNTEKFISRYYSSCTKKRRNFSSVLKIHV